MHYLNTRSTVRLVTPSKWLNKRIAFEDSSMPADMPTQFVVA